MAKKSRAKISPQTNKRNYLIGLSLVIVILAVVTTVFYLPKIGNDMTETTWAVDQSHVLSFRHRELAAPQGKVIQETADYSLEKISYSSYDTTVYGLLRIPKNMTKPPVVIVLPAATVSKEEDSPMANALSSWGYASLTLDERGNGGETKGISPMDFTTGYEAFRSCDMPAQYAQIYDVLLGYDYLRSHNDLDGGNISVLGESMGGRFAVIAAGIEPGFKAAFVVSSSPYGLDAGSNREARRFVDSVEPETYLPKLPPRKLVMFHFTNDTIIPIAYGRSLYDKASQPKAWYQYNGSVHGVYSDMYAPDLHAELMSVFGR
ncbi:MAG: acetylxylan esterase [Methanoregulaceae archaeon]|nr:acetylxylan esterase [Methanoregulaceae archaeon]